MLTHIKLSTFNKNTNLLFLRIKHNKSWDEKTISSVEVFRQMELKYYHLPDRYSAITRQQMSETKRCPRRKSLNEHQRM